MSGMDEDDVEAVDPDMERLDELMEQRSRLGQTDDDVRATLYEQITEAQNQEVEEEDLF